MRCCSYYQRPAPEICTRSTRIIEFLNPTWRRCYSALTIVECKGTTCWHNQIKHGCSFQTSVTLAVSCTGYLIRLVSLIDTLIILSATDLPLQWRGAMKQIFIITRGVKTFQSYAPPQHRPNFQRRSLREKRRISGREHTTLCSEPISVQRADCEHLL